MKKSAVAFLFLAGLAAGLAFGAERKTVKFGRYYEDKAGKKLTPIEWTVLDEKDGKTLLITTKVVDAVPFHNTLKAVTWDNCDLRAWLNGKFFETAFNKDEQKAIALSDVSALKNPRFDTPVGKPVKDKVFLLSYEECLKYMPEDAGRTCFPTDYAIAHECYVNTNGHAAWWLRSNGMSATEPEHLATWGNFSLRHHYVDDTIIGDRPCIWVDSAALSF